MNRSSLSKLVIAVVLLGVAIFMFSRFLRQGDGLSEGTFFYDLSEKKLFTAPREAIAPIRGLNDAEEDAVRAVVISVGSNPNDKSSRKIAYLEKYAPELKRQLEKVRLGQAEPPARDVRNNLRMVKRVEDTEWYPVGSPNGEKVLSEWNVAGPDGNFPVVCVP